MPIKVSISCYFSSSRLFLTLLEESRPAITLLMKIPTDVPLYNVKRAAKQPYARLASELMKLLIGTDERSRARHYHMKTKGYRRT